jgi:hypothetical protein
MPLATYAMDFFYLFIGAWATGLGFLALLLSLAYTIVMGKLPFKLNNQNLEALAILLIIALIFVTPDAPRFAP